MLAATLLALGSAALHAAWNLLIKSSADRTVAAWGQFLAGGALALPVLALTGAPPARALPYLAVSACVHVLYVEALTSAYVDGDFSLAYPLARGGGAVVAALGGVVVLGDRLPALAWVGIAVVVAGLVSLPGRRLVSAPPAGLGWALATAACIGTYTLIDAAGVRRSGDGLAYALAVMPATAAALSIASLARGRAGALRRRIRVEGRLWLAGGAAATVAYSMVLIAVQRAPVGYVTVLRETSVVLAALAGWLLLREGGGRQRLASSAVVLAGLVVLVAAAA